PGFDVEQYEDGLAERIAMPKEIWLRPRAAHFTHVFGTTSYYASAYYSYLWAEMLAADGFSAFEEAHSVFDPTVSRRLRDDILAAGALRSPDEAYLRFRGHAPTVTSLLRRRGLRQ